MAKELNFKLDRVGRNRYPWEKWTNGSAWLLVRGEDFTCSVASMKSAVHGYASRNDLSVVTRIPSPAEVAQLTGGDEYKAALDVTGSSQGLFVQFLPHTPDDARDDEAAPVPNARTRKPMKTLRRTNTAK